MSSVGFGQFGTVILILSLAMMTSGCNSLQREPRGDAAIESFAERAEKAFSEGNDDSAIDNYLLAVKRAWQIDDPTEIGRHAYNLAVCLSSRGRYLEARDWLLEAKAEYYRAGTDRPNVWLLEAKVARRQGLLNEAATLADYAVATHAVGFPRKQDPSAAGAIRALLQQPGRVANRIPLLKKNREGKEDRLFTQIEVELIKGNLACDQCQPDLATNHMEDARALLGKLNDADLRAEMERLSGRIRLCADAPESAACHFDHEAELLRQAKNFREIPFALAAAGEAYETAGMIAAASERYYRVARMLYAQNDLHGSLQAIRQALPLAEFSDPSIQARLALLFKLVQEALPEADSPAPQLGQTPSLEQVTPVEQVPPIEALRLPPPHSLLPVMPQLRGRQ